MDAKKKPVAVTVASAMTRSVETAERKTAVVSILRRMAQKGISCIVVVEQGRPVGIISERDVVWLLAKVGGALGENRAEDVMASPVACVRADLQIDKAIAKMRSMGFRRLPVTDAEGGLVGLVTQTDVLDAAQVRLRQYVRNLERIAQRRTDKIRELVHVKDRFLGLVVHDIRGPICAIVTIIEALLADTVGGLNEQQRKAVAHIGSAANATLALINDFLDVTKIRTGRISLQLQLSDVRELLSRSHRENSIFAKRKGVALELSIPDYPLIAEVDPRRMLQIVNNLVTNAIKFTSHKGAVKLVGRTVNGCVEVQVQDSGVGIAPDKIHDLFNELKCEEVQSAADDVGSGLGLVIVKKLVELHRGEVEVHSELGEGSVFTVRVHARSLPNVRAGRDASVAVS